MDCYAANAIAAMKSFNIPYPYVWSGLGSKLLT